eukprot:UN22293
MKNTYRTCEAYCQAQEDGLECVGAWEEDSETCVKLSQHECDFDFGVFTSDALCECQPPTVACPEGHEKRLVALTGLECWNLPSSYASSDGRRELGMVTWIKTEGLAMNDCADIDILYQNQICEADAELDNEDNCLSDNVHPSFSGQWGKVMELGHQSIADVFRVQCVETPECVYTDCTDAECCEGYECTDRVNPLTGATNRQCVETEEDPCAEVDCGDMGERYECDTSDAVKHFDGTGVCVRDNSRPEMYKCMPNYEIVSCDMGEMCNEETNMCEMEEEKEEFKHMGRGECVDEYERSPPNMSADGMDLYECKYACMMHDDCKAVSHSRGNRCAMWMDSDRTPEDYPPFKGHGGNGSKKGSCMRGGNEVGNWDCWVRDGRACKKRESKESESEESMEYETCEEALWGMTMHLGELQQHAEQCMEDYEMASRMFQDCLDNDLTGEEWECHDYDYWMDKEGRDCAAYEYLGMCEYNYLTIYADEKE